MFQSHKIATCCYCGTRAALVLDAGHHGLQCTSCGAPISNLRHLHKSEEPPAGRKPGKGGEKRGDKGAAKVRARGPGKLRKRAKKKVRSLMGEVFDGLDDLFD